MYIRKISYLTLPVRIVLLFIISAIFAILLLISIYLAHLFENNTPYLAGSFLTFLSLIIPKTRNWIIAIHNRLGKLIYTIMYVRESSLKRYFIRIFNEDGLEIAKKQEKVY